MSKWKPRQDPNKPQNKKGGFCQYFEEYPSGHAACEGGYGDVKICEGNPHNCIKTYYHRLASRSNVQINNGNIRGGEKN